MDILVIGGGAAGLTAAIAAGRRGARVTILEKMKKPGVKLLMTGSGRCNLTHLDPKIGEAYFSAARDSSGAGEAVRTVMRSFGPEDTLDFFLSLGISCRNREGYVYPRSMEARTVLSALLYELERLRVRIRCNTPVSSIAYDRAAGKWIVLADGWIYTADRIILTPGGMAAPKTGSDGSGYVLAKMAGHSLIKPVPALTGILYAPDDQAFFAGADGVRTKARVRFVSGISQTQKDVYALSGNVLKPETEESGEIQWTAKGLSGIVIFQISRFISLKGKNHTPLLSVDLAEDLTEEELMKEIREILSRDPDISPARLLEAFVPAKLAACLAALPEDYLTSGNGREACPVSGDPARRFAALLKNLRIRAAGTRSFEQAQVTAGGIPLSEIEPETMESRSAPGLYLAGEILDADGPCGGYNLQWAWSTGFIAGTSAGTVASQQK